MTAPPDLVPLAALSASLSGLVAEIGRAHV